MPVLSKVGVMHRYLWLFVLCACLDQYDPRPQWEKFAAERELAHRPYPVLADDGTLPQPAKQRDPVVVVREKYATFCANCHGEKGAGDGVGGAPLNVKPRNFRDPTWQQKTTDERIFSVVKNGGPAVGLSGEMAAFGAMFSDEEIKLLIAEIRKFSEQ